MTTKEFLQLVKSCRKLGVTRLKVGEFEVHMSPLTDIHRIGKAATLSNAPATKQSQVDQQTEEEEDYNKSQLAIDDPEAYEELSIKELRGDGE